MASTETTTEQIRNAATLISISLGVLSAFANQRANSVAAQKANLSGLKKKQVGWDLALDAALGLFGLALLVVALPLTKAAADRATPLFHADTAFFALFCLLNVGIGVVIAWVVTTIVRRCDVYSQAEPG